MKLKIYPHQVTGQACLLTTEDGCTIGKPVIRNEVDFYTTMDPLLQPFAPQFRGVGYVSMITDDKGKDYFSVVSCERDLEVITNKARQMKHEQSKLSYKGLQRHEFENETGFTFNDWTEDNDQSAATSSIGLNPWVGRVRKIGKKKFEAKNGDPMHFLFLENISKYCEHPCVLDIKMGTRIYGDRCPQHKRERHIKKNAQTTTSKIGLRLTGMQVFLEEEYICRDKFYGRGLSEDGFCNEIETFFNPCNTLQKYIINAAIEKLRTIRRAIKQLDGYRLYGTSMIIVYDGTCNNIEMNLDNLSPSSNKLVDVRLVDFCHSTHKTMTDDEIYHHGYDKGFVLGISNLIEFLTKILNKNTN